MFLYYNVDWYDHVKLSNGTKVRLQAVEADALVVVVDGVETRVPRSSVKTLPDSNDPAVEYGIRGISSRIKWWTAFWALVMFMPVPFLSAVRLVWMLAIQDVNLKLEQAVRLTFAGNFFNFALPGTTGGDLFKAYYITRYTQHKTEAVTTVFLDRVIGLLGLMFLATVMFAFAWNRLNWEPTYRNRLGMGLGLIWAGLAVGCVFVFSSRLRHLIGLPRLAEMLPGGDQLLRVGRATVAMRKHKSLILLSLGITLVLQALVVFSGYTMARALGMDGEFVLYFICIPIGFLIAAVPISPPQAFGVLEFAYIQFFAYGGLNPKSVAVAFALAIRLIQLVWSLPGVLVPLFGLHVPSQAEMDRLQDSGDEKSGP